MNEGYTFSKSYYILCCAFIVICIFITYTKAISSHLGFGAQYSFSMLNYSVDSGPLGIDQTYSVVGIMQNKTTYSRDYGFSLFYDDGDDFDYLYNTQMRVEYYRFYIPLSKTDNAIEGNRFGLIFLISYDLLNGDDNQLFVGVNTGLYYSKGKDQKNGLEYITMESPFGIVIGDKYRIADYVALIATYTFNLYTNLNSNNYLADIFNSMGYSEESFETNRKEMIFNISCAYQL